MNGMNQLFLDDPVWFLDRMCVDNKTMQEGVAGAQHLERLNGAKFGVFDLVPTGGNSVRLTYASPGTGHHIVGDRPIWAYWCPFLAGGGLPGYIDIPRISPKRRLIFTAAMQGCALVITASPASRESFRVYHHQHPESLQVWDKIWAQGTRGRTSMLSYEQYGNPTGADGGMTNAFNFLWRPRGRAWSFVSQSNKFVPLPMGTRIERDLAKPILDLPAGV